MCRKQTGQPRRAGRRPGGAGGAGGFTLLELVLVMVIITLALAVAAPNLRGWGRGAQLREAGRELLAVTRFARSQAAADATVIRLLVEPDGYQLRAVRPDGELADLSNAEFARPVELPPGHTLEASDPSGARLQSVEFHPTGRTTPARLVITAEAGGQVEVRCDTAAEAFRIVPPGEVR